MLKLLIPALWMMMHPVHVSLLSVDYQPASESFRVFVRVYTDDFLLDSERFAGMDPVNLPVDRPEIRELIREYLADNIQIVINNRQLSGEIDSLGSSELEVSAGLVYFSGMKARNITVRNSIMTRLYDDQANMTIIRIGDFEKGVKLTPEQPEVTFNLKKP
ncbi:MAG: hypothetical protein RBU28_06785 [Bacteroidales bacterium]|jgi:hypothetical protein|nr:hypothetical protein [Bacteroidales bacterium]